MTKQTPMHNARLALVKQTRTTLQKPGFESPFPVAVTQVGQKEWELTSQLVFRTLDGREFVVPAGQDTDFASIPSFLTWLVPSTTGVAAAVLHDYLWRVRVPDKTLTYREADKILREALQGLGVSRVRSQSMWAGVRWGALVRPGGTSGWLRDAPAVLAISVALLPLLAVGVLLVPVAAVYRLIEWVVG